MKVELKLKVICFEFVVYHYLSYLNVDYVLFVYNRY